MARNRDVLLPALLLAAAACGPRAPKGVERLDSGSLNHGFAIDARLRRLYYVDGGGDFVTILNAVDLSTGKRVSYKFPHRQISGLFPSSVDDAVNLAAEKTSQEDRGEEVLMRVAAGSGKVLLEKEARNPSGRDLMAFGERDLPSDEEVLRTEGAALKGADSAMVEIIDPPRPGVKITFDKDGRRTVRFYPTPEAPIKATFGLPGKAYAAYHRQGEEWSLDEYSYEAGTVRSIARFKGVVHSMAVAGDGIILLRRPADGAGRLLSVVEAHAGKVALDLPWSEGNGSILAVDGPRQRLYVRIDEGEAQSCWAVPLGYDSLRAASEYFAGERGPGKRHIRGEDVAIGVLGGIAFVLLWLLRMGRMGLL